MRCRGSRGRAQGADAARFCGFKDGAQFTGRKKETRKGSPRNRRQAARRDRTSEGGAFRDPPAEDALGQDAAPLDRRAGRGPRSGRSDDDRGSERIATDQGLPGSQMKTRLVLTQEDCIKMHAAAEAEARRNNWNVAIAILDDGGHLLHFSRMDGATPANATIAVEKGRTAAVSRRSSGRWQEIVKSRTEMLKMPGILP